MKILSVISTGNELMYGKIADRNSSFISNALFSSNIEVKYHFTTGDNIDDLKKIIQFAMANSDAIIISGGLGPTDDDMTIEALRQIFNFSINIDNHAFDKMKKVLLSLGRSFNESDHKMAEVPSGSKIIKNRLGLAPGFILEYINKLIIALPGVPVEMISMFNEEVLPFLAAKFGKIIRNNVTAKIVGMKESEINEKVKTMGVVINDCIWGITAEGGISTLTFVQDGARFNGTGILNSLKQIFNENILRNGLLLPEEELLEVLIKNRLKLSVAESCTGGLISKRITDIPGSSLAYSGGLIAYSNEMKVKILGIQEELISRHGAVSEEVAGEMALCSKKIFKTETAVSVTGIAGPGGGSSEKPAGTVFFGFAIHDEIIVFKREIIGTRERIRNHSSLVAIDFLRKHLIRKMGKPE